MTYVIQLVMDCKNTSCVLRKIALTHLNTSVDMIYIEYIAVNLHIILSRTQPYGGSPDIGRNYNYQWGRLGCIRTLGALRHPILQLY